MDGKIISGSWDNTLKMWNVNAPKRKEDNIKEAEKEFGQSKSEVEVINVQINCMA
jgi:WD40 repeat protein